MQCASSEKICRPLGRNKNLAEEPILQQYQVYTEWSEPKELKLAIESRDGKDGKEELLGIKPNARVVVKYERQRQTFTAVRFEWCAELIDKDLRKIQDCFLQRFADMAAK